MDEEGREEESGGRAWNAEGVVTAAMGLAERVKRVRGVVVGRRALGIEEVVKAGLRGGTKAEEEGTGGTRAAGVVCTGTGAGTGREVEDKGVGTTGGTVVEEEGGRG